MTKVLTRRLPRAAALLVALTVALLTGAYAAFLAPSAGVSLSHGEAAEGVGLIADWFASDDPAHRVTESAWQRRDALPPLTGLVHGLAAWGLGGSVGDWQAVSLVNLLASMLSLVIVFLLLHRRLGWGPALVGDLLLLLSPGFIEQMQGAGLEPLFGLGMLLLVGAVYAAERGPTGMLLASLAFAALVGLHPSGVVLWIPLLVYVAVRRPSSASVAERGAFGLAPIPLYPFVGLALGLVLLWALWPWLDVQIGKRAGEYFLTGYTGHHPDFAWMGKLYVQSENSAPPFWAGLMLVVGRLPVPLLALATLGLITALRRTRSAREPSTDVGTADLLLPGLLVATLVVVYGLSGTPFYDGNDGLRPVLPLLALVAGAGFASALRALDHTGLPTRLATPVLAALVLVAAGVDRMGAGDSAQSYFNGLSGGRAAVAQGGTQLRPEAGIDGPTMDWLRHEAPADSSFAFAPQSQALNGLARTLQANGALPTDRYVGKLHNTRFLIVPFLPEEPGYGPTLELVATEEPVHVIVRDGLPLVRIYDLGGL